MDETETRSNGLNVFNLHLTNACNYRCAYCFGKFSCAKPLALQDCKRVIDNIRRYFQANAIIDGRINLAGGEPLLYPYLDEVIEYACKQGLRTSIVTNGSLLTETKIRFWAGKVDCIGLSVDSFLEETNRAVGRCNQGQTLSCSKLFATADCIRENGIQLKVNTVVSKYNAWEDMMDGYRRLRPDRLKFFQLQIVRSVNDFARDFCITDEEFYAFYKRYKDCAMVVVMEESGSMENSYLMIDPQGKLILNDCGEYRRFGDCLTEELVTLMKKIPIDNKKFAKRYTGVTV